MNSDGRANALESLPYRFSSDDSSFESSGDRGSSDVKCSCVFEGINNKRDRLYEEEATGGDDQRESTNRRRQRRIHRARFGPGTWHCYVAIVDGASTQIRVDGACEPIKTDLSPAEGKGLLRKAMLDGLTIGSDHCFGMSLCCGYGSGGGEGEGSIAELAVFGGRLDLEDIVHVERQMMERHNIPPIESMHDRDKLWDDCRFIRAADALFGDSPTGDSVPLRYMARHRLVAWHQRNPVTGKEMQITKIGCHPNAESSDWD